jgi:DNA-binding transcriptional LysR family regulator
MDVRVIRSFIAVAEEKNFTRAAVRLNVAQSPLSQQIIRLEGELGVQLFERTTRTVELTESGEVFYARMQILLSLHDDAIDATRKTAHGELGRLSVGFTGSSTYELLPAFVRSYHERSPGVTLDLHTEMFTPGQVKALLDGRLSVGILRPPVYAEGLVVEMLRRESMVALLPSQHRLASERTIDLGSLRDEWFVSYPQTPDSTLYSVVLSACDAAGFIPRVRNVISDTAALVTLVAAGLGVALVPSSLRHLAINGAVYRPLRSPAIEIGLAIAYRENDNSPLVRRFVETARMIVNSRQHMDIQRPLAEPFADSNTFGPLPE